MKFYCLAEQEIETYYCNKNKATDIAEIKSSQY